MPPRTLYYAITDRHLLLPHQSHREYLPGPSPPGPSPPASPAALPGPPSPAAVQPPPTPSSATLPSPAPGRSDLPPTPSAPAPHPFLQPLLDQASCLRARTDFLQLREKDLPAPDLRALALALRQLLPAGSTPRLLLNLGHHTLPPEALLDLATAARLDGLHLPTNLATTTQRNHPHPLNSDALATLARDRFAAAGLPPPILSASTHTLADIDRLRPARPDLLLFGPVFGKVVHGTPVQPPLGLAGLAAAVRHAAPTPVLALGGLTPTNIPSALATGAAGIAAIRLFLPTYPPSSP